MCFMYYWFYNTGLIVFIEVLFPPPFYLLDTTLLSKIRLS